MVRGKVQLKQIENKISRQVTFSKRRTGLFKKAHEISVLCDAEVALMVFSTKGKLFEYSSESSMEGILERYDQYTYAEKQLMGTDNSEPQECWSMEYPRLAARIEILQRKIRNYTGEDLDTLSLRELQNLEVQLDLALKRVRARKNQVMLDSISEMHKKQKSLQEQNNSLANKVKENGMMLQLEEPNDRLQNYSTLVLMPPPRALPPALISSLTIGGSSQGTREADYDLGRAAADQTRFTTTQTIMPQWMVRDLNE